MIFPDVSLFTKRKPPRWRTQRPGRNRDTQEDNGCDHPIDAIMYKQMAGYSAGVHQECTEIGPFFQ